MFWGESETEFRLKLKKYDVKGNQIIPIASKKIKAKEEEK